MNSRGKGKFKVLPKSVDERTEAPVPKLDRQIQARIGEQLRSMYDELLQQPVPDRFADLLRKLDAPPQTPAPRDGTGEDRS